MNIFQNKNYWLPCAVVFFFGMSIFTPSCVEDDGLSKKQFKTLVDTLYNREIAAFNIQLDSTCDARMDSMIQHNKDSIMEIRLRQIQKLIEKE